MANKKDNNEIIEKTIIERKFTNEPTPIQAILPILMAELNKWGKHINELNNKKKELNEMMKNVEKNLLNNRKCFNYYKI